MWFFALASASRIWGSKPSVAVLVCMHIQIDLAMGGRLWNLFRTAARQTLGPSDWHSLRHHWTQLTVIDVNARTRDDKWQNAG